MAFVLSFLGCFMAFLVRDAIGHTLLHHALKKNPNYVPEPVTLVPPSPLEIMRSAQERVDNGYACMGCGHFEPGYDEKRWTKWLDAWSLVARIHVWVSHYGIEIEGGYRGRRREELIATLRRWRAWADSGAVDFERSGLGLDEDLIDAYDRYVS